MTLEQHYQETILAVVGVVLIITIIIVYIWYRLERWCGKCPYRMMCEVEEESWIDQYRDIPLIITNEGLESIHWQFTKPVTYSEDDLEEME